VDQFNKTINQNHKKQYNLQKRYKTKLFDRHSAAAFFTFDELR
jgi:hypothetical protein